MLKDPDTDKIKAICLGLIGDKYEFGITRIKPNGVKLHYPISNCNICGDVLENIIYPIIQEDIPTFQLGPKQQSPDFINKQHEWELKCFTNTPSFDIGNYNSYINCAENNLKRLLNRQYIILQYEIADQHIHVIGVKICNVWELINYTGKYHISVQNKKNIWYNIRPCGSWNNIGGKNKTAKLFVHQLCKSILLCPNNTDNTDNNKLNQVDKIKKEFVQILYCNCLMQIKTNKS
jgi:hypothetical protein